MELFKLSRLNIERLFSETTSLQTIFIIRHDLNYDPLYHQRNIRIFFVLSTEIIRDVVEIDIYIKNGSLKKNSSTWKSRAQIDLVCLVEVNPNHQTLNLVSNRISYYYGMLYIIHLCWTWYSIYIYIAWNAFKHLNSKTSDPKTCLISCVKCITSSSLKVCNLLIKIYHFKGFIYYYNYYYWLIN